MSRNFQENAFQLNNISKIYTKGIVALEKINLTVKDGEFITLVGASGCGKSTILKIIAGLIEATEGKITWQKYQNPDLAFVFQEAALMPWATVFDNIKLPLKLANIFPLQAKRKCIEAIKLVNLEGFENAYPRQLSGGMKMRVSIARALVNQPNLMLMDEPFGALDDMTRTKLNSDLLDLWQQQKWTIIFVTHNIYEAVFLSNRVIFMGNSPGRVAGEIKIDAPYPRDDDFRNSNIYNEYCREISNYFKQINED